MRVAINSSVSSRVDFPPARIIAPAEVSSKIETRAVFPPDALPQRRKGDADGYDTVVVSRIATGDGDE